MKTLENNTPLEGQTPTSEDEFVLNWGKESLKNNLTLANEILKQLITLSTALLGLSIIYDKIVTHDTLRILVILIFFLSLVVSFLGLLPYERSVSLNSVNDIKEHKTKALNHKKLYLWISSFSIIIGFAIIVAELIVKIL